MKTLTKWKNVPVSSNEEMENALVSSNEEMKTLTKQKKQVYNIFVRSRATKNTKNSIQIAAHQKIFYVKS